MFIDLHLLTKSSWNFQAGRINKVSMKFGIQKKSLVIQFSNTETLMCFRPGLLNLASKNKVEDNCIYRKSATY